MVLHLLLLLLVFYCKFHKRFFFCSHGIRLGLCGSVYGNVVKMSSLSESLLVLVVGFKWQKG